MRTSTSSGTSALTQHKLGGRVVSRTIAVHTMEGSHRLSVAELIVTTLHELGHIWCCYGPGTTDGHWSDTPTGFSSVGLMYSPMNRWTLRKLAEISGTIVGPGRRLAITPQDDEKMSTSANAAAFTSRNYFPPRRGRASNWW